MESREGSDALFLYATEGILVVNRVGEIIRVNPSAERLFGYEPGELNGRKVEVLIPQSLSERHTSHRSNYGNNPHARSMGAGMNLKGLRKNGTEFPVEISLSPYSENEADFVIAFIVDATLRILAVEKLKSDSAELEKQVKNRTLILEEAIDELEKTKRELNNALQKEKDLNELKSRFVSMASHEFRTPLTTMLSSLSLVRKYGELNDKENEFKHVNKIKNSIKNMTEILNDFLSLSKLEEGRIENVPHEINVQVFLEEIITEMQPMKTEDQNIVLEHTGNVSAKLDEKLLKNILFNLISNAIKFSPNGGDIKVASVRYNSHVKISVSDNGIGIPEIDQQHLFGRFFRGHNATHIQGTGLGLSIVIKYLELMNGKINFESSEDSGTTFTIIIPQ